MHFDVATLDGSLCYKLMTSLVVPRPIAWLVTNNGAGGQNAAPFSFFNCFSGNPPVLCIGIGRAPERRKDSLANIERDREFVVNMVSEELAQAMNLTATDFPPDWNELAMAGLETAPSVKISVPRIAASPAAFECRLREILPVGQGSGNVIVVADVVAIHPTVCLFLPIADFLGAVREHPSILAELYLLAVEREEETRAILDEETATVEDFDLL